MRIRIRHQTDYAYSAPIRASIQYLRMTPRSGATQAVQEWRVTAPGSLSRWTDHLGNDCHTLVHELPAGIISIVAGGVVETFDTHGVVPFEPGGVPVQAFLRETGYTVLDGRLRDFAGGYRDAAARGRLDALHELMMGVAKEVEYREGETHVHTTAAEAFKDGYGVCQDHAHVFIAACRVLGIPARYVSGFLLSATAETHSAGHAWAEAEVPDLGWVSFDAANGSSATEAYVRIAVGADYAAAGPIRGLRRGGGEEDMDVTILVQGAQ